MSKGVEIHAHGLVCDNPDCNYENRSVSMENYGAWVGALCPDCGWELLTEEQYQVAQDVLRLVQGVNELAEDPVVRKLMEDMSKELGYEGRQARLSIKVNKDAGVDVGEMEWLDS